MEFSHPNHSRDGDFGFENGVLGMRFYPSGSFKG